MWVWEKENWGQFNYDKDIVMPLLIKTVQAVAPLKELAQTLTEDQRLQWEADNTFHETLASGAIEGEIFDRASVKSSIANKLGLYHKESRLEKTSDAFVELLFRAIRFIEPTIDSTILKDWHKQMFIEKPILGNLTVGEYRSDQMQIVSGFYGKKKIDFKALTWSTKFRQPS